MNATTHDNVKGGIEGKFIECVYTRQKFQLHRLLIWLVGWLVGCVVLYGPSTHLGHFGCGQLT